MLRPMSRIHQSADWPSGPRTGRFFSFRPLAARQWADYASQPIDVCPSADWLASQQNSRSIYHPFNRVDSNRWLLQMPVDGRARSVDW